MDDENKPLPLKGKGVRGKAMLFMAFSALLLSAFLLVAGNSVFPVDGEAETEKYFDDTYSAGPDHVVAGPEYVIASPNYAIAGPEDHTMRSANQAEISRTGVEYVNRETVPRMRVHKEDKLLSRGGHSFEFARSFYVEATAYCPGTPGSGCPPDEQGHALCTGSYNDGYTAGGSRAVAGDGSLENPHIIAVDSAVIPFHTLVYLEGYGFARALDRGGAIQGLRIDILFDRHADAVEFGRRQVKLYLFPHAGTPRL